VNFGALCLIVLIMKIGQSVSVHYYIEVNLAKYFISTDQQILETLLYFVVPEVGNGEIPFTRVLNPSVVGKKNCPNRQELTCHTVFTKTSLFLAVGLNKVGSGSVNKTKIVSYDLDRINLEVAEGRCYCCTH